MLRFSPANVKIRALSNVEGIKPYLSGKRKIYSFDLLSGWSCPFAKECHSKVKAVGDTFKIVDGRHTKFRCFSASQEVIFPAVRRMRTQNFKSLQRRSLASTIKAIESAMPDNLGVCRLHVGGDFFSHTYFKAWMNVAKNNPDRLFYAYTKSLPYWIKEQDALRAIDNFIITASYGGTNDFLISEHDLRSSRVVFSKDEASKLGLEIDHDDSHAADPTKRNDNFALLIHGVQPKGSEASEAIKALKKGKVNFAYGKATKFNAAVTV